MPNCLVIEDSTQYREGLLPWLEPIERVNIIAPNDQLECQLMIRPQELVMAIIDFKLTDWVGENNEHALMLNNSRITNGLQMAEHLQRVNPQIIICLYSANTYDLYDKLQYSTLDNDTPILKIGGKAGAGSVRDFIKDRTIRNPELFDPNLNPAFKINLQRLTKKVAFLSVSPERMSKAQQLFYYRQLLSLTSRGYDMWKAGNAVWDIAVNEDNEQSLLKEKNLQPLSLDRFEILVNKDNFIISGIMDINQNFGITAVDYDDSIAYIKRAPRYKLLFELFIVKAVCAQFVSNEISADKTIAVLEKLGVIAQEEAQKYLFRKLVAQYEGKIDKDELYAIMEPFHRADMIKILDIYEGLVYEVREDYAIATLESIVTHHRITKQLDPRVMKDYLFEQNSVFEFVLYRGAGPNSTGSQFMLINS